jgi:hypothetical protein
MSLRVGSAAWTAARLAWRERATASARSLIAARATAASVSGATVMHLGVGSHATPQQHHRWTPMDATHPWWGGVA